MRRIVLCFLVGFICVSCINDELCLETNPGLLKVGFFDIAAPESSKSVTIDSLMVSGLPMSYPDYTDSTVSELSLSLDPDSILTQFIFYTTNGADTLEVSYNVTPSIISIDCGPELQFSELDTLQQTFDSLTIEATMFDPAVERHFKIYVE